MASNIFARYIWLIDQLRKFKRLNLKEINAIWVKSDLWDEGEISERTFHNHRKAIEEIFDVEIKCDPKDNYRYYIADLEYLEKDSLRCWVLNSFATLNEIRADKSLCKRIRYEDIPSGHNHLSDILTAMRMNLSIKFIHRGFHNTESREILLHPYCVSVYARRWYVIGLSATHGMLRTFAFDRIRKLELTKTSFTMPEDFSIAHYFEGCCGILVQKDIPIERVVIDVFSNARDYVATLPLHKSQREIARNEEFTTYEYRVRPDFNFIQRILEQADMSVVREPKVLCDQIRKIAEHLTQLYEE